MFKSKRLSVAENIGQSPRSFRFVSNIRLGSDSITWDDGPINSLDAGASTSSRAKHSAMDNGSSAKGRWQRLSVKEKKRGRYSFADVVVKVQRRMVSRTCEY